MNKKTFTSSDEHYTEPSQVTAFLINELKKYADQPDARSILELALTDVGYDKIQVALRKLMKIDFDYLAKRDPTQELLNKWYPLVIDELAKKVNLNQPVKDELPLLHIAATNLKYGDLAIKALIKNGADIKVRDNEGLTAFQHLLSLCNWNIPPLGSKKTFYALIEAGVLCYNQDIDSEGNSLLHKAVEIIPRYAKCRDLDLASYLLKHGANIDSVNNEGYTPLHLTVSDGRDPKGIELLLAHGASPLIPNKRGNTPIDTAQAGYPFFNEIRQEYIKALKQAAKEITNRKVAFAMLFHPRLGANSPIRKECLNKKIKDKIISFIR